MCFEHKYKLYINSQARFEYVLPSEYGDLSGLYFSAFSLNAERYSVSLRIQPECGKMRTRITPRTDTFYAVMMKTLNEDLQTY